VNLNFFLFSSDILITLNQETQFENLFNTGKNLQNEGRFKEALEYFKQAHNLAKKLQPDEQCDTLVQIGLMNWNLGNMEVAKLNYENAQIIAQKNAIIYKLSLIENVLHIHSLYNSGKRFRGNKQFQESINSFQEAIKIAREISSKEHEIKCLRQQSITYQDWQILDEFLRLNQEVLVIAESLNHKREEAYCTNNIGWYHLQFSNYSTALEYFNRSLQLAEEFNMKNTLPKILNNMGIIYKNLGEFEKALAIFNKTLEIDSEENDLYFMAFDLNNIGTTLRQQGLVSGEYENLFKALVHYNQCLDLAKKIEDKKDRDEIEIAAFNNMGTVYSDLEDYEKALKYFNQGYQKAVELNEISDMGMLLNNLGIVHSNMGNYTESTEYFLQSIDLGTRLNSGVILWEAYLELARNYVKQNRKQDALIKFQDSINQIEKIRSQIHLEEFKASFMGSDKRLEAYQDIISLLVSLHREYPDKLYDEMAFNFLERGKARAFLDSLEISQVNISQNVDFILLNREAEIMKEISTLYTKLYASSISNEQTEELHAQLDQKENELEALKREIRSKSPAYANLKYPNMATLNDAQSLLDKQTAFLEYSLGENRSFAFVITKNDYSIYELPNKKEIKNLVTNYLKILSDKQNDDFSSGHQLFNTLVRPGIQNRTKNIVIIADDILHYLPFETLMVREKEKQWLILEHEIAYASSISSLKELIDRKNTNGIKAKMDLLAFGDPYFGPNENNGKNDNNNGNNGQNGLNYSRLEFSEAEIERISSLFRPKKTNVFYRENASEDILKEHKLNNYKIIHFATHSEIDDERPTRSNIVLTIDDNPDEDGILQAREIYNLELNADLVTMSACKTGLGKFIRGEGIEGLNRAFFYAGTSSLVMSLWPVNDQATSQLMERFYFYLKKSNSIMSSLRSAKLELIESEALSHPYYWAGFIVSGKADHVVFPKKLSLVIIFGITILAAILLFVILRALKPRLFTARSS
jgi:CHAT domain-containing protein/Tfp pilus assembly protein PilF